MTARAAAQLRRLRLILWGLVLAVGLAASWFFLVRAPQQQAGGTAEIGQGSYAAVTTDGGVFSHDSLIGAPSLVFFGFTHCPDICPTTLADIATWQDIAGVAIRTFVVTVDPARDTPEVLGDYVGWLPGAVGVTGSDAQIEAVIRAFKIYAARVPTEDGYTMDHSAYVMLFDAAGRFDQIFSYQADPEAVAARLQQAVAGGGA